MKRLRRRRTLWRALSNARAVLVSRLTAPVRGPLLGPFTVRRLDQTDVAVARRFTERYFHVSPSFIEQQLTSRWSPDTERGATGAMVGAFTRRSALCACAWFDEFRQEEVPLDGYWVRSLVVAPSVRSLGLGAAILGELERLARAQHVHALYADVAGDNHRSLRVFRRCGFVTAEEDVARRLNELRAKMRSTVTWNALVKRL
jgi:mycothiol synthase